MPVVEMEGAPRIMLASNNYLGLTGDERVMKGARGRAAPLRHGPDRLAPAQRHDAAAPRARARAGRVDGHRGRDRLHDRPPGQRRHARHAARSRRHRDRRLRRPRLDPRRRADLARRRCARSATTASTSSSARWSAPSGDGGGVLVVVDGVFSMEGDVAPLVDITELCARYGARLMVDEAHGAGVLGARGAGASELLGVEDRVDLRMGTFSKSLAVVRRLRRGTGRGDRVPADLQPRRSCSPPRRSRRRSAPRSRRCASSARTRARRCSRAVLERARYLADGLHALGYRRSGEPVARARRRTRRCATIDHADRPGAGRRGLEGGAAVARAV